MLPAAGAARAGADDLEQRTLVSMISAPARSRGAARMSLVALAAFAPALATPPAQAGNQWFLSAQRELAERLSRPGPITGRAKNVILFIADGNGISTNYATRLWSGQQDGGYGDEAVLPHESLAMPYLALSKTYNTNAQTPVCFLKPNASDKLSLADHTVAVGFSWNGVSA